MKDAEGDPSHFSIAPLDHRAASCSGYSAPPTSGRGSVYARVPRSNCVMPIDLKSKAESRS